MLFHQLAQALFQLKQDKVHELQDANPLNLQKYDFITHQEFSMTKHFSFETNESRRHFMKLMAGVGAGLAFSLSLIHIYWSKTRFAK